MILLRAIARLLAFVLLVALAVAGAMVAVFCVQAGTATLSLHHLAALVALPDLRNTVGPWLRSLEADGPVAIVAVLCGVGAVVLGIALLLGVLVPRRERLVTFEQTDTGVLAARRRALARLARALAEQASGVTRAKARVRAHRRREGGRLRVTARRSRSAPAREVSAAVADELVPLSDGLPLATRVQTRLARGAPRVR